MAKYKITIDMLDRAAVEVEADSILQALKQYNCALLAKATRWEVLSEITKVEKVKEQES